MSYILGKFVSGTRAVQRFFFFNVIFDWLLQSICSKYLFFSSYNDAGVLGALALYLFLLSLSLSVCLSVYPSVSLVIL